MTESDGGLRGPIKGYDSFLLTVGAWTCLLATIVNAIFIFPKPELATIGLWQVIYSTALGIATWNFNRRKLEWRLTIALAALVVVDFLIWMTVSSFHFPVLILFGPVKAVFVLLLLLLAYRESVLRKTQGE